MKFTLYGFMNLKTVSLTKNYRSHNAVDKIDLEFTPGIWGLLGANGAGKTTFIKMLVGVLNPTSGDILFGDNSIKELEEKYRKKLGYLPQKFGYYEELNLNDYLLYVAALKGISKKDAKGKISYLLEKVSLTDVQYKKIRTFSGGMKQRVGIAQALLNDPQVLILDEPTAGLDIEERRKFREFITNYSRERMVLISTHIVSDIAVIKKGKLVASGSPNDLISSLAFSAWEVSIPVREKNKIEQSGLIINYHNEDKEDIFVRYISNDPLYCDSERKNVTLEDYYIYINSREEI